MENEVLNKERSETASRMTRMRSTINKLQRDLANERNFKVDAMNRLENLEHELEFSDDDSVVWGESGRQSTTRNTIRNRETVKTRDSVRSRYTVKSRDGAIRKRDTLMNRDRVSTSFSKTMNLMRESRARPISHAGKIGGGYERSSTMEKHRVALNRPKSGNDAVAKANDSVISCVGQNLNHNQKRSSVLDAISRGLIRHKMPNVQDLN